MFARRRLKSNSSTPRALLAPGERRVWPTSSTTRKSARWQRATDDDDALSVGCAATELLAAATNAVANPKQMPRTPPMQAIFGYFRLTEKPWPPLSPCRDRLGNGDRAACHVGVQAFDHATLDRDNAPALVFRLVEGSNHLARLDDLFARWRKCLVARLDLAGMDESLAIKAKLDTLTAFSFKPVLIADVIVDAVENIDAVDARRGNAGCKPREHGRSARHETRARILSQIIGAHH